MLVRQIKYRKIDSYLTDYMIQASVMSEDKSFIEELMETQKQMYGEDSNPQLDREALQSLKNDLSGSSNTIKTDVK